ncbi:MAG TPA: hypothetical protein VES79_05290, partial [Solirubrobacteraceae bacterium]|nr:hypothetical protein [Solirubrobacteraceae bacterium]
MARPVGQFAVEHIAALVVTAISAGLLVRGAQRQGDAWAVPVARGLALCILIAYLTEHLTYVFRGEWTTRVNLPLQLTDAVTLVSVAALWCPRAPLLVELLY